MDNEFERVHEYIKEKDEDLFVVKHVESQLLKFIGLPAQKKNEHETVFEILEQSFYVDEKFCNWVINNNERKTHD